MDRMKTSAPLIAFALLATLLTSPASAVTLHQGDLVAIDRHFGSFYTRIVRMVPGSGVVDQITMRGLLQDAGASDLEVMGDGRILVATWNTGIVAVEPGAGTQSVYLTNLQLGGNPTALARGIDGELLILVNAAGEGRILRDDPQNGLELLTAGSDLTGSSDLARSPNNELFVSVPGTPASVGGWGRILRLSAEGARLDVFTSEEFRGPTQLAITGNGRVYASNWGAMNAGYGGRVTRTEIATATTVEATYANGSSGVAVLSPERVFYSMKVTDKVGEHWSVQQMAPVGWGVADVTGPITTVAEEPVPARSASWGAVKRIYR